MKSITVGMDLGDQNSVICELNDLGDIVSNHCLENTKKSLRSFSQKDGEIL